MAKDPKVYPEYTYFFTLRVAAWTDVFIRQEYREIITESLQFSIQNKGLRIYAFCLMTNHLHMIASGENRQNIAKLVREFKSFTGKQLLNTIETNPSESRRAWLTERFRFFARTLAQDTSRQFWDRNSYPVAVESDWFFEQKRHYIEENPVRAGFVLRAKDWAHSSANPDCPISIVRY